MLKYSFFAVTELHWPLEDLALVIEHDEGWGEFYTTAGQSVGVGGWESEAVNVLGEIQIGDLNPFQKKRPKNKRKNGGFWKSATRGLFLFRVVFDLFLISFFLGKRNQKTSEKQTKNTTVSDPIFSYIYAEACSFSQSW